MFSAIHNRIFTVCLILLPLILLLYHLSPPNISSEQVRFIVPMDAKKGDVVQDLTDQNLIRSPWLFNILLTVMKPGNEEAIEPGAYMLTRNMNLIHTIETLLFHPYQKWVVLPPGLRIEQTAEKLVKALNWDEVKRQEFLENAREGYMFPDTYLINTDYSGKETAAKLIANFNEKFDEKIQRDLLDQDVRNDTAVKIASLIERESGGDEDKALISGIIWNRLSKGMPLQIDASIQYAKGETGNWWPKITLADYKLESEYNTYLIKRLPPSPICSPSLASIKAVVYPEDTDCLYYLHSSDKQIHCAETYEGHRRNIEMYLK